MKQNSSKNMAMNMMAEDIFKNFGTTFDVYQLQGGR